MVFFFVSLIFSKIGFEVLVSTNLLDNKPNPKKAAAEAVVAPIKTFVDFFIVMRPFNIFFNYTIFVKKNKVKKGKFLLFYVLCSVILIKV